MALTRFRPEAGAISLGIALTIGALVGVGVGAGLAFAGAVDPVADTAETRVETLATVDAFECPVPGDAVTSFTQGDRLFVTALDPTGTFARVRDPRTGDPVWLSIAALSLEAEPTGLPVQDCSSDAPIALVVSSTTTSTSTSTTTTSTTSTTSTTTTSTTTTTTAPDTAGPQISDVVISSNRIDITTCPNNAVTVSATVTDASNIDSLTVRWRYVDTPNFPEAATFVTVGVSGTSMTAVIDDIASPWNSGGPTLINPHTQLEIRIRAVDAAGNATAVFRQIELYRDCGS